MKVYDWEKIFFLKLTNFVFALMLEQNYYSLNFLFKTPGSVDEFRLTAKTMARHWQLRAPDKPTRAAWIEKLKTIGAQVCNF